MKINKLHAVISLFILISAANVTQAQTRVGIKAGVNFSNVAGYKF